jgi:hypothetical protein
MVQKSEGGVTTVYTNQFYEKNITSGEATTSYYLGSKLIALRKGTSLSYVLQDQLGSTVGTVESNLTASTIKYFSFGDCRNSLLYGFSISVFTLI